MSLIKCKECSKEISSKAKACPHCGAALKKKGIIGKIFSFLFLSCFILAVFIAIGVMIKPGDSEPTVLDTECRNSLRCWGDKNRGMATALCTYEIERFAKYNFQWIDKLFEPKLSHYSFLNMDKGIITYSGDKIQFQNGFGAMVNHNYECDYDTINEKVLNVRVYR